MKGSTIKIKDREDIHEKLNWFQYNQILSFFEADKKKYGFKDNDSKLEEIILNNESKFISKIYKQLMGRFTEEETVKIPMTNLNKSIQMSSWEYLWSKAIKISISA